MASTPPISRALSLGRSLAVLVQPIAALVTRLVLGWSFRATGWGKWHPLSNTVDFFTRLHIPAPRANAAFIATLELVGGICLMLGLGTRAFAFLLACTMVVAILTDDWQNFVGAFGGGKEDLLDITPVVFLMFLLWLIAFGAGPISLDRLLFRKQDPTIPS